jgi:glutamine amidotransferase
MSMVITLNPLLKFSAGQWNTLVNIGLALCGLAGQDCIGTNTTLALCARACCSDSYHFPNQRSGGG